MIVKDEEVKELRRVVRQIIYVDNDVTQNKARHHDGNKMWDKNAVKQVKIFSQ